MNNTIATLKTQNNFLIITHRRPDGDTQGSASALCQGLRSMGKTAYILENNETTEKYSWLIVPYYPPVGFAPDFIITTDIASVQLFSPEAMVYSKMVDLAIDHHPSYTGYAKTALVKPRRAACGEIIYELLSDLGVDLTRDMAEAVYVAVSTDTGCFRYSNTEAYSHVVAAGCLDAGIDGGELNRRFFETKTRARFELERLVFDNIEFLRDGLVAVLTISRKNIQDTGSSIDDLDSISALPRQVEGVEIGITITEQANGEMKLSVRTNSLVSATEVCKKLGGGGHLRAAGATLSCSIIEAREQVLAAVWQVLDHV